jgi:hypothetical protein
MLPRRTWAPQDFVPQNQFKFEYLQEFESEYENISGYESGAHMRCIYEKKTRGGKSRATVPSTFTTP